MNIQQRIWAEKAGLLGEDMHPKKKKKGSWSEELSPEQSAFRALFDRVLKKHGVDSPNDLADDKKDDFFDEVGRMWKEDPANKPETNEAMTVDTPKTVKGVDQPAASGMTSGKDPANAVIYGMTGEFGLGNTGGVTEGVNESFLRMRENMAPSMLDRGPKGGPGPRPIGHPQKGVNNFQGMAPTTMGQDTPYGEQIGTYLSFWGYSPMDYVNYLVDLGFTQQQAIQMTAYQWSVWGLDYNAGQVVGGEGLGNLLAGYEG